MAFNKSFDFFFTDTGIRIPLFEEFCSENKQKDKDNLNTRTDGEAKAENETFIP